VDVRRVQAGLAAVLARPVRARADEPDAGARRVEVDLPVGPVEGLEVVEELRVGVRALEDLDLPRVAQHRAVQRRDGHAAVARQASGREDVPAPQRATAVAAEVAQRERRRAAQQAGDLQAACDQHVRAQPEPGRRADVEDRAAGDRDALVLGDRLAVERHAGVGAGDAHLRRGREAQRRALERALQARGALRVAQDAVAQAERAVVHRARGRDAHVPEPHAPGVVLDRRHRPRAHDLDARLVVGDRRERPRGVPGLRERLGAQGRAQQPEVRADAVHARVAQAVAQAPARLLPGRAVCDDLGQQRVVVR
jgi:hypothetical protein